MHMDSLQGNSSLMDQNTHLQFQTDMHNEDARQGKGSKFENGSCSSSSSSDTSYDEDFFQLGATEFGKDPPPHAQLTPEIISGDSTTKHEAANLIDKQRALGGSPELPVSTVFSPDSLSSLGVKQSPPIQTMGRLDVPDPNRIPSSIFARTNTTTPMDWSMASNESLFSIQMGNSSFSRDHVILLGKSQELGNFSSSLMVMDLPPPVSPPPVLTPLSQRMALGLQQPGAAAAANAEAMNDVMRAAAEERNGKERTLVVGTCGPRSTSTSRLSDGSVCSFAFPILTGEGRDGSIKVGPEHQPIPSELPVQAASRTETPKAAAGTTENKWFALFLCCPMAMCC